MNERLRDSVVRQDASIADAMRSLERSSTKIVLVVDDSDRLLGTVTDGDLRRALLGGAVLDSVVAPHMNARFFSVEPSAGRSEIVELMQARQIAQVPVVDDKLHVVGLHLVHEMLGVAERPNWAVVMAGGRGTRLAPLTDELPKPMLPVAGRPILERIILQLVGCGIRRVFLAVNYKAAMIEDHFGNGHDLGCHIDYLREDKPLGTIGALGLLPEPPTEPLLVMNGDLVSDVNLSSLIDFHADGGQAMTLAVRKYYQSVPFGCVETDGADLVKFVEKPTAVHTINAGIYVMDPEVVAMVAADESITAPDLAERAASAGRPVRVREIDGDWIDVGRPEELRRARGER